MAPVLRISNELGILKAQPRARQWQQSPWVWEGVLCFRACAGQSGRSVCSAKLRDPVSSSSTSTWRQQAGDPRGNPSSQPSSQLSSRACLLSFLCCRAVRTHPGLAVKPNLAPGWPHILPTAHGTHCDPCAGSCLVAEQKPGRAAG